MLSGSITVPAYTTYAERDYEYIINDCSPTLVFVSNDEQFRKLKNIIKNKNFIKKIFSFEKLSDIEEDNYININDLFSKSTNKNNNSKRVLSLGLSKKGNSRHPLSMPNEFFLRPFEQ